MTLARNQTGFLAFSTLASKDAEIAGLRAERDEARKLLDDANSFWQEVYDAAESEATRLRTGIQNLIDGTPGEQTVQTIKDRLEAILKEAKDG